MTLLSHTMSQEDYAKACEDGFDPRELDQDTAVTIVDRMKAELVRSGQNIAGYTDDIDLDTLRLWAAIHWHKVLKNSSGQRIYL